EQVAGGRWWEKHLERAYQSGADAGGEMVGSPPPGHAPVPAVYRELAAREFAAIAATMVQHVSRQAAAASVAGRKPLPLYQQARAELAAAQARAEAEVAAAKAATAARVVRASAAWEKVKAARRAVALASPARAQAAAQAQPERVVPPGYERVAAETVGKATIP